MRTFRGPNIDSDHYLIAAKFPLRISVPRSVRSSALRKVDVKKLRSQKTAEAFSALLSNKLRLPLLLHYCGNSERNIARLPTIDSTNQKS